jgi:hypothetical protein
MGWVGCMIRVCIWAQEYLEIRQVRPGNCTSLRVWIGIALHTCTMDEEQYGFKCLNCYYSYMKCYTNLCDGYTMLVEILCIHIHAIQSVRFELHVSTKRLLGTTTSKV